MDAQARIEDRLRKEGYRITNQRRNILQVLLRERENILSAQQIYERVIDHNPRVNFSTVYRNIEILEDLGILHRIHTGEGYGNFKLNEQNRHHHHFICKLCGKTEAIDFCPLKQLEETLRDRNFIPTEHHFEIFGYCQKCMKDREKEYYE